MKYYKYDNGLELPFINEPPIEKIVAGNEDNYIEFSPSIETQNMVLPSDIKFGSMAARYPVTDILDLRNKTELSFNKQETNLSLTDKDGHEFAVLRGENITDGKKKIDAVVNYEFGLSEDSKLTLGTRVSNTTETNTNDFSDGMTSKQSVRLELTDHNHEYITTNTFIDNKGVSSIDLSSKYKAGDGFVGGNIQLTREGARAYSVDVFDQGDLSNAGLMYSEDAQGAKTFGVNSGFFLDKSLRLSTQYSRSDSVGQAVSLHFQKKVSENTSMVLQVGKSEIGGSTVMYQLQSKF